MFLKDQVSCDKQNFMKWILYKYVKYFNQTMGRINTGYKKCREKIVFTRCNGNRWVIE